MQYQWYPGHMAKAKKQMLEDLKLIDVLVELVDARIPISSKNPDIEKMAANKSRVILLNKYDMADERVTDRWVKYYEERGYYVVKVNSRSGAGIKKVNEIILKACEEKIAKDRAKGILFRPVRAMICGIPNVGKSTFINSLAGKGAAKTGNKPGVTKGKQWIKLNKNIELLDTPGILWPKFDDVSTGKKIAFIGSINDDILISTEVAADLMELLMERYSDNVADHYGIELSNDKFENLEKIAIKRGCLMKGGVADVERASRLLVDDFRSVRLGRISLETPEDFISEE